MKINNQVTIDDWLQVNTSNPSMAVLLSKLLPIIEEHGDDFIKLINALATNEVTLSKVGTVPDRFKSFSSLMGIKEDMQSLLLFCLKLGANLGCNNTKDSNTLDSELLTKLNSLSTLFDTKSSLENLDVEHVEDDTL